MSSRLGPTHPDIGDVSEGLEKIDNFFLVAICDSLAYTVDEEGAGGGGFWAIVQDWLPGIRLWFCAVLCSVLTDCAPVYAQR